MKTTISITSILITGLSSGLFYAWAVSVIPGTRLISDKNYLETMQQINKAILNPWFMAIFFGAFILLGLNTYQEFRSDTGLRFWLKLSATIIYLVGTFMVTAFGNVPLNNGLDIIQLGDLSINELQQTRINYEAPWNRLHMVRTIFSVISFALLTLASQINLENA